MKLLINPTEGKGIGKEADSIDEIVLDKDEKVEKVLEQYDDFAGKIYNTDGEVTEYFNNRKIDILKPAQIDILLHHILISKKEKLEDYNKNYNTGFFLSELIQYSYDDGNNNFTLTTKDSKIDNLGYQLKGIEKNPIIVDVKGDVGEWCGENSYYSKFNLNGNVGYGCGQNSQYSKFNINGNVEDWCGDSSTNCIFSTPNRKTYEKILKSVSKTIRENKIKTKTNNKVIYTGK